MFFLMILLLLRSTRTASCVPYTSLFRSHALYGLVRPDIGRGDIYHRFADAPEILERNALGQQRTAGSCDGGQRQWLRRQAIYKLRRLFLQRVEKLPRLVHAEHLRRIKRDQMDEVRRNDRRPEERRVGKECVSTGKYRW